MTATRSIIKLAINPSRCFSISAIANAAATATKKTTKRKTSNEPPKKPKVTPEAEMKVAVKKAAKLSEQNPHKMTIEEAVRVLRAVEVRSPWSAYDLLVKTAVMRGRPVPRGKLQLPRDPKTTVDKVLVFAEESRIQEALDAGATYAGGVELIDKVLSGEIQPTKVLATPSLVPLIAPKLARFLGPKGMMPAERKGTATTDIVGALQALQGVFEWKGDKGGSIRTAIARINFPVEDVIANVMALMKSIRDSTVDKDEALQRKSKKTRYVSILSVHLSSRQGPGIELLHV